MNHPERVNAGFEFTVTVHIQKGALTDYSRFSQDLPLGLTATNISSPNADFSFDNQRIRVIWLKLPEQNEVKISYNIMVDERLKGTFSLGGVFAYVVGDERRFLNIEQTREISIIPNPSVDPAMVVDIGDFQRGITGAPGERVAETPAAETMAAVIRQKPRLLGSGAYVVRLLVENPQGSKYAKIEETIPSGYLFEQEDNHDAIVSFAASTVKFIWMKLPEEPLFEVSYRLVPKQDEPQSEMAVDGLFTYTAGEDNRVVEIRQVDADLDALTLSEKRQLLQSGTVPPSAGRQQESVTGRVRPPEAGETQSRPPLQTTDVPGTQGRTTTPAASGSQGQHQTPPAGEGVYYRVQLIATESPIDANALFRSEGIDREVFVEQDEGFYKYTAGYFEDYEQASAYRDWVQRLPSADGPFVVAYRNGRRIGVPAGSN